jgi:hypothetical protein
VVVAAELTQQANDLQQLAPMLPAIRTTLAAAGIGDPGRRLAADSGYWSIANMSGIPEAPELLMPPARHGKPRKDGKPSESKSDSLRAAMRAKLDSTQGKACYAQRSWTIEPVFGQVKTVQSARPWPRPADRKDPVRAGTALQYPGSHARVSRFRSPQPMGNPSVQQAQGS